MRPLTYFVALLAVLSLLVAACTSSGGDDTTTTTSAGEDVVFGSGELPDTVPSDFPFPEQGVIGATLIDRPRGLTEFVATYPAVVSEVVAFYETNLPAAGYEIVSSEGNDGTWDLEFARDDLTGEISVDAAGSAVSAGAIRMVQPPG